MSTCERRDFQMCWRKAFMNVDLGTLKSIKLLKLPYQNSAFRNIPAISIPQITECIPHRCSAVLNQSEYKVKCSAPNCCYKDRP